LLKFAHLLLHCIFRHWNGNRKKEKKNRLPSDIDKAHPQTPWLCGSVEPPDLQNIIICFAFFRFGFRFCDRTQYSGSLLWDLIETSLMIKGNPQLPNHRGEGWAGLLPTSLELPLSKQLHGSKSAH
jgi:hypothetical protein